MDNDSLNKWPNWIRWAIAYPAALIGSLLIAWLIRIVQAIFQQDTATWWLDLAQDFFIGALFVYISAWFVPKANRIVAIVSMCIVIALAFLLVGVTLLAGRYGNNLQDPLLFYVSIAALIGGAVTVVIAIHTNE